MPSDAEIVSSDPFFGVVRRRHPDVDIVLLPPEQPSSEADATAADAPAPPLLLDPAAAESALREHVGSLWQDLIDSPAEDVSARWETARAARRLVVTAAHPAVGGVEAAQALARLQRRLESDGWHVLVPATGMPRVLASRASQEADEPADELLAVHVPGTGRFALEWRRGPWRVEVDGGEQR